MNGIYFIIEIWGIMLINKVASVGPAHIQNRVRHASKEMLNLVIYTYIWQLQQYAVDGISEPRLE